MKITLPTCKTEKEAWTALRAQTSKFTDRENNDGVVVPMDENGRQLREAGIRPENGKWTPFLIISLK